MEQSPKLWANCDINLGSFVTRVSSSNDWLTDFISLVMRKVLANMEIVTKVLLLTKGLSTLYGSYEDVEKVFERSGLRLSKQETVTVCRAVDGLRTQKVKLSQLLKFIVDWKEE